jgi:hypothetical protein
MMIKNPLKSNKGQARILEAAIAAAIIFIVFSASTFLISASDVIVQERADLDRLGYNTLHELIESGTVESTVEGQDNVNYLKIIIQRSLPSATYFNLTIFRCEDKGNWVELQFLTSVSNTDSESFAKSREVSSTNTIYTSKRGYIYHLVLILARGGGG